MAKGLTKGFEGTVGLIALGIAAVFFLPVLIPILTNQAMIWLILFIVLAYFLSRRK